MNNKTLRDIIDGLICDKTAPPLVRKALYMDIKRYCELKLEEQRNICINDMKNIVINIDHKIYVSDIKDFNFGKPTVE